MSDCKECERLRAENERLKAECKDLQSFNNDLCADLCSIEDALGLKHDQFNPDGSWKPTRDAVKEKLRDLIAAVGELGDAKAENARLLAEWSDLLRAFQHYHVNSGVPGDDKCKRCGLDLRHAIHIRYQQTQPTKL